MLDDCHFCEGELDKDDVRALLAFHYAQMRDASPPEACHVLDLKGLTTPDIRFFSLRDAQGQLLGIGALKALSQEVGEIKSMRTADAALGRGVGKAVMNHLIAVARAAGMKEIKLETGNSPLYIPANRLYEGAGFTRCGPFAGYQDTPFTYFYAREI